MADEMYFRYCSACSCYEYDCHGLPGCIKLEAEYKPAHARHRDRVAQEALGHTHIFECLLRYCTKQETP